MGHSEQGEILAMNNYLPAGNGLNVQALSRIFDKRATSYKFAFFQALLTICSQRGFTHIDGKIECKSLAVEMAAFAWYPHTFHKLSFGHQDELGNILNLLNYCVDRGGLGSRDTMRQLRTALNEKYLEIKLDKLLRYVPLRLLTPFFEGSLKGEYDHKKNNLIRSFADEAFSSEAPPLYRLTDNDTKVQIHPNWLRYLKENFGIVNGWMSHQWVEFLQSKNPNVPAISCKTRPPASRASLARQIGNWRQVIEKTEVRCIYSNEILRSNSFQIDHFLPWSFVCHDQPWNLIPAVPPANAAKGNWLPSTDYFNRFIKLQSSGLSVLRTQLSKHDWKVHSEPFLVDLRMTEESLVDFHSLGEALRSTLLPLLALAKQTGFSANWEYPGAVACFDN